MPKDRKAEVLRIREVLKGCRSVLVDSGMLIICKTLVRKVYVAVDEKPTYESSSCCIATPYYQCCPQSPSAVWTTSFTGPSGQVLLPDPFLEAQATGSFLTCAQAEK